MSDTETAKILAYQAEKRNMAIAYILWFFLGELGIHRFYIGNTGSGVAMLLLFIFGLLTVFFYIGVILLVIWFVWWIVDAFLTSSMVNEKNLAIYRRIFEGRIW